MKRYDVWEKNPGLSFLETFNSSDEAITFANAYAEKFKGIEVVVYEDGDPKKLYWSIKL